MKFFVLTLLTIVISTNELLSQCEAPILTNWHVDGADDYEISFEMSEAGNPYLVKFSILYTNDGSLPDSLVANYSGIALAEIETVSYDLSSWLSVEARYPL